MSRNKKSKEDKCNNSELWTEDEYDEYMKDVYGMEFIAGYTENGVPYGTFIDEGKEHDKSLIREISNESNDELPF